MKCHCGGETEVIDTRPGPLNSIRRRRECVACGHRITTSEALVHAKRGGARGPGPRITPKSKAWLLLSNDERKAIHRRNNLRAAARREARGSGEDLQTIYVRWGCE